MKHDEITVNMLGDFSITRHGNTIYGTDNRMHKVQLLIAYFIYSRGARTTQSALSSLLWAADDECVNPQGALKTMLYRARNMLNKLYDGAGYDLILYRDGNYTWNTDIPLTLDIEEFEKLCKKAASPETPDDEKISCYLSAVELYNGDFLPKLSMETWVVPIAAHYHQLYLESVGKLLDLLIAAVRHDDASDVCRKALKIEPYSENLYAALMRSQIALGKKTDAAKTYETVSEMLYSNFGVMPSDETRALYREATRSGNQNNISLDMLRDQLREENEDKGALFCDYDFFKAIYRSRARIIARSGETVHIALITVDHPRGKTLSERSLNLVSEKLKEEIISNLRQGDIVSQCSSNQFIIMLPLANYENSCLVCGRILRAYFRKYPHSPADIRFNVLPLEPRGI